MEKLKRNAFPVIRIILFFGIFFFLFIMVSYIMKPPSTNLNNIAGFYGEKKNSLDVVYIGGSACFVYWQPLRAYEKEGITSYSFAANSISADTYKYLVQETLKRQDPELIILDARAFQYRDTTQTSDEIAYRNILTGTPFSIERAIFIEHAVRKYLHEETTSYHFDIAKYHTIRDGFQVEKAIKMMLQVYQNPVKGFEFIPQVKAIERHIFQTNKETPMSDETTEVLDELLQYLKTTNKKYLFVVSPYEELETHKENFNFIERKVKEAGFDFLDANDYVDEMQINYETDFYNYAHMNIYGSEKYSDFLIQYLKEHHHLIDHRNDPNYKDWDLLLPNWNEQATLTKQEIQNLIGGER